MRSNYRKNKAAEAWITPTQGGYSIIWKGAAGTGCSGVIRSKDHAQHIASICGASEVLFVATPVT